MNKVLYPRVNTILGVIKEIMNFVFKRDKEIRGETALTDIDLRMISKSESYRSLVSW